METGAKKLHLLTGFTAAGKTAVSLRLAKELNAEIVNCDSLLFYRGMDIGTAKPNEQERCAIRHHLIDIVDPSDTFSIDRYIDEARTVIDDIHGRGKAVLVVGGSGFYLQAFLGPVVDRIVIDPGVRASLLEAFEKAPLSDWVEELRQLNPDGLGTLDTFNPRRVFNALLRCRASGLSLAELKRRFEAQAVPFDAYDRRVLVLGRPKEELEERVMLRVHQMLEAGLVDEVRALLDQGLIRDGSAARSIGYRETIAFIEKGGELNDLAKLIAQNTRRLLKKQRTWFRKHLPKEAVFDLSEWDGTAEFPWVEVG